MCVGDYFVSVLLFNHMIARNYLLVLLLSFGTTHIMISWLRLTVTVLFRMNKVTNKCRSITFAHLKWCVYCLANAKDTIIL